MKVVKSLRCMCLSVKAELHYTTIRGNAECTPLTTSIETSAVFDLNFSVRRGYT